MEPIRRNALVERVLDFCFECEGVINSADIPLPPKKTPFVVKGSNGMYITLEEYPNYSYCASRFVVLQEPDEVAIVIEQEVEPVLEPVLT